jgi:excisionase family DNA binding protein
VPKVKTPAKTRPSPLPPGVLNVHQAAARLNVSARLVRLYLSDGTLQGYREGAKRTMWRVPESAIEAYIARRMGEGGPAVPVVGEYQHLRSRRQS